MSVYKTEAKLADGRSILYFDEQPGAPRRLDDPRDLPRISTLSRMRKDLLTDQWVVIASHRQDRTFLPPADECPLCPSRDGHQTEIPSDDYDVVVFENRFPSLASGDGALNAGPSGGDAGELFAERPGNGRCEVVCFTADHDGSFAALTPNRARMVLEAWIDRTTELSAVSGVEQVFCFENRGEEIGVTLRHPHGQIYGYPYVTPRTRRLLDSARQYREQTGGHLIADLLAAERAAGDRVVVSGEHWTAFVPWAARWPVEVHLVAHRRVPDLAALGEAERAELVDVYLDLLRRLDRLYDLPLPYISAWHQAPVRTDRDLAHLHLQLFSVKRARDKLKYLAGSESAMDAFVNDIAPEQMAERLRQAGP